MNMYVHTKVCIDMFISHIIHNSPKLEIIHMSIRWWVDKQNMVYPNSGLLCNNKKEETTDIYNKTNGPMNLKNIMVIDTKYYIFIYINVSENAKL